MTRIVFIIAFCVESACKMPQGKFGTLFQVGHFNQSQLLVFFEINQPPRSSLSDSGKLVV